MTSRSRSIMVAVALLLAVPSAAAAQGERTVWDDLSVTLGGRVWVTTGHSSRSSAAAGIDPLSELRWRGVDSIVPEVNVDVLWNRLVVLGSIGGGVIGDGTLIDDDFAASGQRIHAVVVGSEGNAPDVAALLAHCARQLPTHMLPKQIEVVPELPRTPNGKVDYQGLRATRSEAGR